MLRELFSMLRYMYIACLVNILPFNYVSEIASIFHMHFARIKCMLNILEDSKCSKIKLRQDLLSVM
jgi:hypothetical protein